LQVISIYDDQEVVLGKVSHLLETGANDVLVVKGDVDSLDETERLIPYVPEQYIKDVDLDNQTIKVDWDPEF
jgi:16S rRNA processing protein RimM